MDRNKDGLIPGQIVDFETIQRVNRERAQRAKQPAESKREPRKATRQRQTEE